LKREVASGAVRRKAAGLECASPRRHAGCIDWQQFERIQLRLRQNLGFAPGEWGRMPREGNALHIIK